MARDGEGHTIHPKPYFNFGGPRFQKILDLTSLKVSAPKSMASLFVTITKSPCPKWYPYSSYPSG